jgi:hypothetical protein
LASSSVTVKALVGEDAAAVLMGADVITSITPGPGVMVSLNGAETELASSTDALVKVAIKAWVPDRRIVVEQLADPADTATFEHRTTPPLEKVTAPGAEGTLAVRVIAWPAVAVDGDALSVVVVGACRTTSFSAAEVDPVSLAVAGVATAVMA